MAYGSTNAQALNPTEITNAINGKVDKKSSGATYGIATPDTSAYTSDRTIATTDDVATKLDKDTTTSTYDQSYVKKADGTQALRSTTSQRVASSIVMRDANNQINVADTPTSNSHATSKKYVDDLILKIYPIGAIYMSVNNTNPTTLFGGTWEQIQDKFLLSAGSNYTAGDTGGEATHTLTTDEMPSHNHKVGVGGTQYPSGYPLQQISGGYNVTSQSQYLINNEGGGQAHNNMPPYLVVYVWKRTA